MKIGRIAISSIIFILSLALSALMFVLGDLAQTPLVKNVSVVPILLAVLLIFILQKTERDAYQERKGVEKLYVAIAIIITIGALLWLVSIFAGYTITGIVIGFFILILLLKYLFSKVFPPNTRMPR